MAKDKVSMPTSTAGITRYTDDSTSKVHLRPHYILVLVVLILIVVAVLHIYGSAWLGLPPLQ